MQNLSDSKYAKNALVAGSSMNAGNTTNNTAAEFAFSAPGSAPVNPLVPKELQDDPNIEVGPVQDYSNKVGTAGKQFPVSFDNAGAGAQETHWKSVVLWLTAT
jgi:hypothetical protein